MLKYFVLIFTASVSISLVVNYINEKYFKR